MATKNDVYKVTAVSSQGKKLVRNIGNVQDAIRIGTAMQRQHCSNVHITTYIWNVYNNRYEVKP